QVRRRAALLRARGPGGGPEGVPVRRGAEGRAQAVGVQGLRHRVHPGDTDRHLHGVARGCLRRVLQLRPPDQAAGQGSDPVMSGDWVQEALRVHEEAEKERRGSPQPLPGTVREELVLERIDRARRSRPRVKEERITMAHGAGGKATHTLIEAIFLDELRNPLLEPLEDAARLQISGARLALTTDSYVVAPLFFPGGDIGDLAVNGTVNDLATS